MYCICICMIRSIWETDWSLVVPHVYVDVSLGHFFEWVCEFWGGGGGQYSYEYYLPRVPIHTFIGRRRRVLQFLIGFGSSEDRASSNGCAGSRHTFGGGSVFYMALIALKIHDPCHLKVETVLCHLITTNQVFCLAMESTTTPQSQTGNVGEFIHREDLCTFGGDDQAVLTFWAVRGIRGSISYRQTSKAVGFFFYSSYFFTAVYKNRQNAIFCCTLYYVVREICTDSRCSRACIYS